MSPRSMTGFGRGDATHGGRSVQVEISAVNRKQLDVVVNLPRGLAPLEPRVQDAVSRTVARGRVAVNVTIRESAARRRQAVSVDTDLAASYLKQMRAAARALKLRDDLGARDMLTLPGVVRIESPEGDVAGIEPLLLEALGKSLADFNRMRAREGRHLAADLRARLALMTGLVGEIRACAPDAVARYRDNLRQRIETLRPDAPLDGDRLEREVVFFADKADITEELTRLDSHVAQAAGMLRQDGPAGKALDFVAQEMGREINTIGSKGNDAAIARRVVVFKTELERFREQVQNIE